MPYLLQGILVDYSILMINDVKKNKANEKFI